MALQTSVSICGAQLSINYNAGNGRATSLDLDTPRIVRFRIVLTNGTIIDNVAGPGQASWPLPANLVRLVIAADGEVSITGIVSIEANT